MRHLVLNTLLLLFLAACSLNDPVENRKDRELISYPVNINSKVIFQEEELGGGRVLQGEDQVYFFIGIFEVSSDSMQTNPHTSRLLYACGGFRSIPENLILNLYSNTEYTIQTLALKKSNFYGIALDEYLYDNITYERLYLAWEVNSPEPAILTDSISYQDLWLSDSNGGVGGFDNGYIYSNADSSEVKFTWPLMANSYYESKKIITGGNAETIQLNPERQVFGVKVTAEGLTDSTFVKVIVGPDSDLMVIKESNNGETYIFAGFTTTAARLKISKVTKTSSGAEINSTLYYEDFYHFQKGKTTVIDVSLTPSTNQMNPSFIQLLETPLEPGDTLKVNG